MVMFGDDDSGSLAKAVKFRGFGDAEFVASGEERNQYRLIEDNCAVRYCDDFFAVTMLRKC